MRTIFEDTTLKAELEETRSRGNESKFALPALWLIAMIFLGGTWAVYRWADNRPAMKAPPPPVSLDDPKQTAEALNRFNIFVAYGNWTEAEAMLSTAAKQRLSSEQKSLRDSLLGGFKDSKIVGADRTDSIDRSVPGRMREDSLYKFINNENYEKVDQRIISMVLVNENNKLVIDSWEGIKPDDQRKEDQKQDDQKKEAGSKKETGSKRKR